jgi:hypothetical protein
MRLGAKLTNFREMSEMLAVLPAEVGNKVMGTAIDAAARPIERRAVENAPANRGALKKSISRVVRKYPGSAVPAIAIVGPNKDFTQSKLQGGGDLKGVDRPANYAHLVEFGYHTRAAERVGETAQEFRAFTAAERRDANRAGRALPSAGRKTVIFVPPNPFLRRAVRDSEGESAAAFEQGCVKGLERETKRLNRMFIKFTR